MSSVWQKGIVHSGTTKGKLSNLLSDSVEPYSLKALLLSLICIASATLVRDVIDPEHTRVVFATYYPAVLVATLLAGFPAGIVAMVGSVPTVWWAFHDRSQGFAPFLAEHQGVLALYLFSSCCIVGLAAWHREVLRRLRQRERERELIVNELEHRGRNTYAIIEAIIRSTLQDDLELAEALSGRIRAVKYTNDLINGSADNTVLLKSLLLQELAPYGDDRARIDGGDIELPATVARSVALVFHEMVTNAAKYGALSRPCGRVVVSWQRDGERVALQWKEEGGPTVTEQSRHGFGTRLVTKCIKSLSGSIEPAYTREGLRCEITFRV